MKAYYRFTFSNLTMVDYDMAEFSYDRAVSMANMYAIDEGATITGFYIVSGAFRY